MYEPHELGQDGYPLVWHSGLIPTEDLQHGEYIPDFNTRITWVVSLEARAGRVVPTEGVKHVVRMQAGHRCVRCGHPFIVGKSGVMEGPHAEGEAFAASLGMTGEQLDMALMDYIEDVTGEDLEESPRVNWSACDQRCTHGGPVRWRVRGVEKWIEAPKVGLAEIRVQLRHNVEIQAAWRILTVHHLNGRKNDLRWWNLIPVCQRCHLWLQARVVMERVYPFEHDDYFKPYAAGWYASTYLGEELTRAQTMERLDELLALERMA